MHRLRIYTQNLGTRVILLNALLLAYVLSLQASLAASGSGGLTFVLLFTLPAAIAGLFGPRLILGWLVEHARPVLRVMRWVWYAVAAAAVLVITGFLRLDGWVLIPLLFMVFTYHGVYFWLFSDPRIMTPRALARVRVEEG